MSQRVLVLSAAVGAGHMRAAQAVELAVRQIAPAAEVKNVDLLTLTNATFRRVYGQAYLELVNKAPHVLGYFYDWLDRAPSKHHKADRLRKAFERINLRPFRAALKEHPWDVVIHTHFLPASIVAHLRTKHKLETPHVIVTTDFETHRLWVNQPCDHYFTATAEGAANLRAWGVPERDVSVTGIPIHPVFSEKKTREECQRKQGLVGDRPTVLLLAGGFGVGPIEKMLAAVLTIETPLELVAVAGRNEKLRAKLAGVAAGRHRLKVVGFTDQIDEFMRAADIVVSKPGGLTTSETLACGAAMAVVNPIPGQESRNSDFLLENGAAIKINNLSTLAFKLGELLADPERMTRLRAAAAKLGRPSAAFDVAKFALALAAKP